MTHRQTATKAQKRAASEADRARDRKRKAMHELMRLAVRSHGPGLSPEARAQRYDTIMARACEIEEGGK